jgi:hypothetical protein
VSDVYFADQICYLTSSGTINRDHAVCFGLVNATSLLERTFLFRHDAALRTEQQLLADAIAAGKTLLDPDFPRSIWALELARERVLDNFLIGTFFEVVAKAFLLEGGYLVHKIRSVRGLPEPLRILQRDQSKSPVDAGSYAELDPFEDFKGVGRNGMQYLEYSTLSYGWLYENGYGVALPFADEFKRLARDYRVYRNEIHFPLAGASEHLLELDPGALDVQAVIRAEIEETIRPLFVSLRQRHNFRFEFAL